MWFFGVFIRAILEQVCESCNIYMILPFCFAALNLSTYSIYLPAIYLAICLYEVICPSFLKAALSVEAAPFIKTVYLEIQIHKKGFVQTLLGCVDMYCHQKLLS